jgi:DNA-binding transcriptional MerR regulator
MAKLLYTMGEVAEMLGEAPSAVRYWSNYFEKYVKPQRNAKGNRLFHQEDIDTLKQIQFLVKNQGLTLEGVMQKFKEDRRSVDRRVKALDSLKAIRKELVAVRNVICK